MTGALYSTTHLLVIETSRPTIVPNKQIYYLSKILQDSNERSVSVKCTDNDY